MKITHCRICSPPVICTVGPVVEVLSHDVGNEVHTAIGSIDVNEMDRNEGESNDAYFARLIALHEALMI